MYAFCTILHLIIESLHHFEPILFSYFRWVIPNFAFRLIPTVFQL